MAPRERFGRRTRNLARMGARLALLAGHDAHVPFELIRRIAEIADRKGGGMAHKKVIGLLVGRENTLPGPFIELVNVKGANDGITAEVADLRGPAEMAAPYHAVLIDRVSDRAPYY